MLFLTPEESRNLIDHVADRMWPVGSVFISTFADNPAERLGVGVWEPFGEGRVLVGQDVAQPEFDALGKTGGVKEVTLDESQLPAHTHGINDPGHAHIENTNAATTGPLSGFAARDTSTNTSSPTEYSTQPAATGISLQNTGGGQPHTNLQPYLVVKFWKRVS